MQNLRLTIVDMAAINSLLLHIDLHLLLIVRNNQIYMYIFFLYKVVRIHNFKQLYFRFDNSSIEISTKPAISAVQIPINKKINHLAKFFLTINL